jgi:hypothetical protein
MKEWILAEARDTRTWILAEIRDSQNIQLLRKLSPHLRSLFLKLGVPALLCLFGRIGMIIGAFWFILVTELDLID